MIARINSEFSLLHWPSCQLKLRNENGRMKNLKISAEGLKSSWNPLSAFQGLTAYKTYEGSVRLTPKNPYIPSLYLGAPMRLKYSNSQGQ